MYSSLFPKTEKPGVPQKPFVSSVTKDSCVVSWKAPSSDGGAKIKNYYLEKREKKQNKWIAVTTEEIHETSYTVKGLLEGFEYEFRVKCENIGGESDWSEISEPVIPKSDTALRAPFFKEELRDMCVKYRATATFVTKVIGHPKPVVKWYKNGKEILPDGEKTKVQEFKGGYFQIVISNADENDAAVYQIRATNQLGSISKSMNLEVEVPAKIHLPLHLQGMGAVHAIRGEVVTIKIPISGKPDPVVTWQKGQEMINNTAYHQVIITRSFTSLVFLKGVQRKDSGYYIICAKNRFGVDKQTVELAVADVPDPPKDVKVSDIGRDTLTLTWSPGNDGGSEIINYIIEKCPTTGDRWIRVAQTSETEYTVMSLFGKTKCQFRVIAENHFGLSGPSVPTDPVTTKEDKLAIRNYDEEVDETREITKEEAPHSKVKLLPSLYTVSEELARNGQFGIVHRCVEISSKKTFLAKSIKVKGADRELVAREIETLNIARHKNIVYLHESFDSLEEYVLIYEFISGMDIFERLGTNFDLTEQEIVRYMRQVCGALKFLHSHNYCHFDIRPDNIVYSTRKSNTIKIIDMGQARLLTPGENIRIQFTAPEYCAPEIHNSDFVTTATDMWSVGVLAYVLLSGLNPFAAESHQKMVEHISSAEYVFDSEAFKETSLEGMDFVDRLLTKDRKLRMTASEALEHPWLKMKLEYVSSKVIKTLRHRRYYQSLVKKEWSTVISAARVAYGGGYRNQRNVSIGRVKVGHPEQGLRAGPVMHCSAEEGGHIRFVCCIENYNRNTEVTWYFGSRKLTFRPQVEVIQEDVEHHVLHIRETLIEDSGTYRVTATNTAGSASCQASLKVERLTYTRREFKSEEERQ
uniref:Uncharacterized protein n=1 Tax=Sinocyclocheilus anshuiensis TaxID=1608454 RepID=A0A671KKF0_9TELE